MALNIVFTSEKLTPIVLKVANSKMNAKLDMKSVELTFFHLSTFWIETNGWYIDFESHPGYNVATDRHTAFI